MSSNLDAPTKTPGAKIGKEPLHLSLVANAFGQGWRALTNLAFIPLYVKYLGIESYALIGIFGVMQAWLSLLDVGMKPTLGREMARFTGGAHDVQSIRNLLRTIEIIGAAITTTAFLGIWAASGWLASEWLRKSTLPTNLVAKALAAMGFVVALRFLEDIYVSGLAGLQRQVEQNIITSIVAGLRSGGAVLVLIWISPTITAFFVWQGIASILSVLAIASAVHRVIPQSPFPAQFSKVALKNIWRFAAGMMAITLLSVLLTQIDKILLARMLTLENFGYYTLAGTAAGGLFTMVGPITAAFYPRFNVFVARNDHKAAAGAYHLGAQCVSTLMGSAALLLIVFGRSVIQLWTGDPLLSQKVTPIMTVLAVGNLLNGLVWIPYQMMLAYGWTSLTVQVNTIAVTVLVPLIIFMVPRYGALGAAWIWVGLTATHVLLTVTLMHRRILCDEKWRWYGGDVVLPIAAATAAALICRLIFPQTGGKVLQFASLAVSACLILLASCLASSLIRARVFRFLQEKIRPAIPQTTFLFL